MNNRTKFIYFSLGILVGLTMGFSICKADPYLAIGQGVTKFDIDPYYIRGFQSADDSTKAVSHIAVGYDFNNDWALEVGYEDFNSFGWRSFQVSEGQINTSVRARGIYAAGKRYFGRTYVLLGAHKTNIDADISRSIAGQNNQHISTSDVVAGLGYDIEIFDHLGLRLSYTKFMGIGNQNLIGSKTDAGVVGIAMVIR